MANVLCGASTACRFIITLWVIKWLIVNNVGQIFLNSQTSIALCSNFPSCFRFIQVDYLTACQSQPGTLTSLCLGNCEAVLVMCTEKWNQGFYIMYAVSVHACGGQWKMSGIGFTGDSQLPGVAAGSKTGVLWKNRDYPSQWAHFPAPVLCCFPL